MYIFFTLPIYITVLLSVIGTAVSAGGCVIVIILLVIFRHFKMIQIKRINLRNLNIERLFQLSSSQRDKSDFQFVFRTTPDLPCTADNPHTTHVFHLCNMSSHTKTKTYCPKGKGSYPKTEIIKGTNGPI